MFPSLADLRVAKRKTASEIFQCLITSVARLHTSSFLMDLELQAIVACFDSPISEAARRLKTCTTNLKKVCRAHGIQRWPYRKVVKMPVTLALALINTHTQDAKH